MPAEHEIPDCNRNCHAPLTQRAIAKTTCALCDENHTKDGRGRRKAAFCHNLFVWPVRNITVGTQLINQRELSWTLRTFVKRPRPADDGQKRCRGTTLNGSIF